MSYKMRIPNDKDYNIIEKRLYLLEELNNKKTKNKNEGFFTDVYSIEETMNSLKNNYIENYIIDNTYLVCISSGYKWFSNKKFLNEELVLRLHNADNGVKFDSVISFFYDMAEEYNIDYITVGGALPGNKKALIRLYKKYGFELIEDPNLFKKF